MPDPRQDVHDGNAPGAHLLTVGGDVDAAAVPALRTQAEARLAAPGLRELTLDFSGATSLDSSGLGLLVWLRGSCVDAGVALTLRNMAPRLQKLFVMVGLDTLFVFADTSLRATAKPDNGSNNDSDLPERASGRPELRVGPDHAFDRFAALTRRVLGVPSAMVSIVDERAHTIVGMDGAAGDLDHYGRTVPLSHSFCLQVARTGQPLVVTDARSDPQVAGNPAVQEFDVVAYAGTPLLDLDGDVVGALCATDSQPHEWTRAEVDTLVDLAAACSAELQLRGAIGRAAVSADRDRLARHLHEKVTSELLELSLKVGSARSLSSGHAATLLDDAMDSIDAVLKNIRETLYEPVD